MKGIIVSDATPIIAFSKINRLKLLEDIVGDLIIPEGVSRELFAYKKADTGVLKECRWIKTKTVNSQSDVNLLLPTLDKGESEVIILAKEINADIVVIDELSARKVAIMLGLPVIGTIGLLIAAKEKGLIEKVKPIWDEMIAKGIRYSKEFYRKILNEIDEI